MDKKNLKRFEEVQPNSSTREELLVIMYYLQNYAYDRQHASTQKEIIDFAEEKYGLVLRRDRVGSILIHLEQISKQKPDLLPFVLETIEFNKIKKYYVPQRQLSDDDVVKIVSAIIADKKLSKDETKRLMEVFVNANVTKAKRGELLKRINLRSGKIKKVADEYYDFIEDFIGYSERGARLVFRLEDPYAAEYSRNIGPNLTKSFASNSYGYAAMTYYIGGEIKLVVYVDQFKLAFVTSPQNLQIVEVQESRRPVDDINYEIETTSKDKSVKAWVDAHYKGVDGRLVHFKLKVYHSTKGEKEDKTFKEFKEKYKDYWSKPLEYTLEEREINYERRDKEGNPYNETLVVYDAVFELDANIPSFENWYMGLKNFDQVIILDPAEANDYYLGQAVRRYANRLTKYGVRYNYTLTREYKPEYLELKKEREARLEERRAKRQEALAKARAENVSK